MEDALIKRRPKPGLKLRSDNGLIFGAEDFHRVARSAGIRQEYITPYTPEQNGLIKRWFRTLKTECLWLRQYETVEDARSAVAAFIDVYHNERPHRSLNMLTPSEWMERFAALIGLRIRGPYMDMTTASSHRSYGIREARREWSLGIDAP